MKKLFLLIFAILLSVSAFAQLEVKKGSFKEVPGFVNINLDKQTDDNDRPYAVVKIKTENISDKQRRELLFEGDGRTFIECEYKVGEVWLYISYYASYIKISHPEFSSTEFALPFDMQPKKGYEMILVNKTIPVSSGWASLTIQTKPENGAIVLLNGRDLNATTPYTNNMLAAGIYEITVSKNKFETTTQIVDIQDGDNKIVEIEMPYLYGKLYVTSEPSGANVIVDGTNYGVTPIEINTLVVGTYELKLEKSDCAPVTKTITLDEKNRLTVDEELPTGREIFISTDGTGDKIFVDDNYIGESPLTAYMSFGEHDVKAVRNTKESKKTITVAIAGGTTLVNLVFGAINGVFSVSSDKKVKFSQGNLQYQASTNTWRFAENQLDMLGYDNNNISSKYSGWIDLFGWGTGDEPTKSSKSNRSYKSFSDWGNNTISNGGGGSWFTLTHDEWEYLFDKRSTSSGIRYAKATVNGVNGVILLPDNWSSNYYSLSNTDIEYSRYSSNQISQSDWTSMLEANGAVFLPAAGWRDGKNATAVGEIGYYWSATYIDSVYARNAYFFYAGTSASDGMERNCGISVRLVTLAE